VTEVTAASVADNFHAPHAVAQIDMLPDAFGRCWSVKAGPPAVAFEFGSGIEEMRSAPHADVDPVFVVQPEFA
jgi:hypothetical protein